MRNIWLVMKHDVQATLQQTSFWVLTVLMPLILVGINGYATFSDSGVSLVDGEAVEAEASEVPEAMIVGLIDEAALIKTIPSIVPEETFRFMSDQTAALSALADGEVEQVVVIAPTYIETGQITVYERDFQITSSGEGMGVAFNGELSWLLQYLIDYNLSEDEQLPLLLNDPVPADIVITHVLQPEEVDPTANSRTMAALVASLMPYVFYFLLVMGANYMMRSVIAEKENRTVEQLLLSLDPRQLMIGKILAMSAIVALQVAVWIGSGILLLDRGASLLNSSSYEFPQGFVIYAVLFLVLGFLLYAAIMTMAGSIAPTVREGSQMIWLLIIPLMPTLMFGSRFAEEPHGKLATVLSIFPFSSPSAMVTRIAIAEVPIWQIGLSLGLLTLTSYGFVVLASHFFRSENLLSNAAFSWRRLATSWR